MQLIAQRSPDTFLFIMTSILNLFLLELSLVRNVVSTWNWNNWVQHIPGRSGVLYSSRGTWTVFTEYSFHCRKRSSWSYTLYMVVVAKISFYHIFVSCFPFLFSSKLTQLQSLEGISATDFHQQEPSLPLLNSCMCTLKKSIYGCHYQILLRLFICIVVCFWNEIQNIRYYRWFFHPTAKHDNSSLYICA